LANACEEHLFPEATWAKALVLPVSGPAWLSAATLDTVLVHPLMVVEDASFDTAEALWAPSDAGYVAETLLFPFRLALTPPCWAAAFVTRSVFDLRPRPPSARGLEAHLLREDPAVRLLAARDLRPGAYQGDDVAPATRTMLNVCRTYPDDVDFCEAVIARLPAPLTDEAAAYLEEVARTGRGRLCAVALWRLFQECCRAPVDDEAAQEHFPRAANRIARVYDALAAGGHHEAEVFLIDLATGRAHLPAPRAVAFYCVLALSKRGWPAYAAAAAFRAQTVLLASTESARLVGARQGWAALRVRHDWLAEVKTAIDRRQLLGGPPLVAALERQRDERAAALDALAPGAAAERLDAASLLLHCEMLLEAERVADALVAGPEADVRLFFGNSLELLKEAAAP